MPTPTAPTVAACFALLAASFAPAADPAIRAKPPTSSLHLKVPGNWKQRQVPAKTPKTPPLIVIDAASEDGPLSMKVQIIPLGKKTLSDDQLKQLLTNMATPFVATSVEGKIDPVAVTGETNGYSVTLNPKDTGTKKTESSTTMVVQMPGLALAVAMTHHKDAAGLIAAIEAVRTATYGPTTQPAR